MSSFDQLLALKIQPSFAFFDSHSVEKSTGTAKPKYKLAGNYLSSLSVGTFFILTTNSFACRSYISMKIDQSDWDKRDVSHLKAPCSYTSLDHFETLTTNELSQKIRRNGFFQVAVLKTTKFNDFKKLINRIQSVNKSKETKKTIVQSLADEAIADRILKELNLD